MGDFNCLTRFHFELLTWRCCDFRSTIFVSNLSYSTTQGSLQAAFDDIAPVKICFIVHEKAAHLDDATSSTASAKGPSKGVGYVTFAIKEDAEGIINRFGEGSEELRIDNRVVRVKWADRKVRATVSPEPNKYSRTLTVNACK